METEEFWEGFISGLNLVNIEVDKVLSKCYNDRRTQNDLLDVKTAITRLREMTPNGEETLANSLS